MRPPHTAPPAPRPPPRFSMPSALTSGTAAGRFQAASAILFGLGQLNPDTVPTVAGYGWRSSAVVTGKALIACAYNQGTPYEAARIIAGLCADLANVLMEESCSPKSKT